MAKQQTLQERAPATQDKSAATSVLDTAIEQTSQRAQSIRDTAAQFLGVPPQRVCDLLRNVWSVSKGQEPLTDGEMFMGMSLIARYGLDPIVREVYVTRGNDGRLMVVVGIDGWVKILSRTEDYDGFDQEIHYNGENIDWVETKIFSKDRSHPSVYRAFAKEYMSLAGFMAKKIPSHMLRLFSLRHAARLFTPIGGSVVTEEEARWMQAYENADEKRPERRPIDDLPNLPPAVATEEQPKQSTQDDPGNGVDPLCAFRAMIGATDVSGNLARKLAKFVSDYPDLRDAAEKIAQDREFEIEAAKQ